MNVIWILMLILFILMAVVGRGRGVKSFFTLVFNFITLFVVLVLIASKVDPIQVTVIGCIVISLITLFYINGVNTKTVAALLSVIVVVLVTMLISYKMGLDARIQGFGKEQAETISYMTVYVNVDFSKLVICEILLGLLGAIIDVAISISSSIYEMYKSNPDSSKSELIMSGMNIGKDILGTMTNTLLFAFIGGFMTLAIYFNELHYSLGDVLNAKVLCAEIFTALCSGIGIILIIPVTAFITASILSIKKSHKETVNQKQ